MERVIITGASAGVGRACAMEFAKGGAKLGLIARDLDRLGEARREALEKGASDVEIFSADVASFEELEAAAREFFRLFGGVDVWVNNAMTSVFAEFHKLSPREFQRVTDVVYHGYVWGTQIAVKQMERQGKGRILLIGSALAYRGIPLQSAYCGAKHAIQGMFDSVRSELLHRKSPVSIGMLQLPAVNTPQFNWTRNKLGKNSQPVPPIYQPEVIGRAVYWMAHRKKRELFVGGPSIKVILGNKIFPALGDWYLAKTGYKSQQTEKKLKHPKKDNLFSAPKGNFSTRGEFGGKARSSSAMLWMSEHKVATAASGMVIAGLILSLM